MRRSPINSPSTLRSVFFFSTSQISFLEENLYHACDETLIDCDEDCESEVGLAELLGLTERRVHALREQLKALDDEIEANNGLAIRILDYFQNLDGVVQSDVDKFKLLTNESDVIINLLLKHCCKLAAIENCIFLNKLQGVSNDLNTQELVKVMRKKDETVNLKQGIDKRASFLKDSLKKYLTNEQLNQFETFLNMKSLFAIHSRHISDKMEMIQEQQKLLAQLQ